MNISQASSKNGDPKSASLPPQSLDVDAFHQRSGNSAQVNPPSISLGTFIEVPLYDNAINQWFWFVGVNLEYNKNSDEHTVLFEDGAEKIMKLDPQDIGVKWKDIGTFNAEFKISCFKKILKLSMPAKFEKLNKLLESSGVNVSSKKEDEPR
jgi:hypothetical protein